MGSDFPTSGSGLYAYEESSRMGESEFLSLSGKIDLGISRGQENPHWILFYKKKQTKNTLVVRHLEGGMSSSVVPSSTMVFENVRVCLQNCLSSLNCP